MEAVPWTKQQDFCLRLGLLRALLAILPPHDRSTDRGPILRRLDGLIFAPLSTRPDLERRAREALGGELEKPSISRSQSQPTMKSFITVADGLLVTSGLASWGQPIDHKNSSKLLEWGQSCGFVGRGNQITERGKLLRSFFDVDAVKAFAAGNVDGWNPFEIPPIERAFLLYHLGEHDEVLWRIAVDAGRHGEGATIDTGRAHSLTAAAMRALVDRVNKKAAMSDFEKLRPLIELTRVIEAEASGVSVTTGHKGPPKSSRSSARERRHTTKNADHQAIPRCEMLVDLGLLTKEVDQHLAGPRLWKARKGWTFRVTGSGDRFASTVAELSPDGPIAPWHWKWFASASAAGGLVGAARIVPLVDIVDVLFDCYARVARAVGHTPLESVVLLTSLESLRAGKVVEVETLHALFMKLKSTGVLQQHLFFAGRNELDRMFVVLRPSGREPLRQWLRDEGGMS